MKTRLQNILSHAGVASRRSAGELIESGKVEVDGNLVKEKGLKLDPDKHKITVNGRRLPKKERKLYFLFYKPKNVISTASDTHDRKTVIDFFEKINARLYPIGRLDRNTTGILIITNDGDLTNKLAHPRYEIEKEYEAIVEGKMSTREIKEAESGIEIEGKFTAPCKISMLEKSDKSTTLKIKLHEGKKRQIRVMFESVGHKVVELKRVKYAGLTLGRLKAGHWRELTKEEVKMLRELHGSG